MNSYDRRAAEEPQTELLEDVGELEVAEYIVFLLALDTYIRAVEETTGAFNPVDPTIRKALAFARQLEATAAPSYRAFIETHLANDNQKKMLAKAFRFVLTPDGTSRRALQLRTVLSRGGTQTMRAVFKTNKALQDVRAALTDSREGDAHVALAKFAAIQIRNPRIKMWIHKAAERAATGEFHDAVTAATDAVVDATKALPIQAQLQAVAEPARDSHAEATSAKVDAIQKIRQEATQVAAETLAANKQPDAPVTKSEAIGIATAAAAAVQAQVPSNLPKSLQAIKNDPEQLAAALTNGKVLVAAGAGAGKSTTLVARIGYLIQDQHVPPARILACSFNKKAADELKLKIKKAVGEEAGRQIAIGTMHSLFRRFIVRDPKSGFPGYGTPAEQAMFDNKHLIAPAKEKTRQERKRSTAEDEELEARGPTPGALNGAVKRTIDECDPERLAAIYGFKADEMGSMPKAKQLQSYISKWKGNGEKLEDVRKNTDLSDKQRFAVMWWDFYAGLKGDNGAQWVPPCGATKNFKSWMGKWRPAGERLGDLDDMVRVFGDILARNPEAKAKIQGQFDHMLVDECQDLNKVQHEIFDRLSEKIECNDKNKSIWMVGDDKQCPSADTEVDTPTGKVLAKCLKTGDFVLAYRNGALVPQRVTVTPSSWTWGYRIHTASGRSLLMSPNHKIWATEPFLEEHQVAVYMMFREDLGFRVGITNKGRLGASYLGSFAGRAFQEKAERMWILAVCDNREDALLEETSIALTYGIPTCVFNGKHRGLNQERLDQVFKRFGRNGLKVLEDRNLSLDLPHWMSGGYSKHGRERRVVHMRAHATARAGSLVSFEWTPGDNDGFTELLRPQSKLAANGRLRFRKCSTNYREALEVASGLARKTGAMLDRGLATQEGVLPLVTAGSLFVGMRVPVWDADTDTLTLDPIVSVEREDGTFIGLDVDDASNFFGGGILSHNSIYQFRGAKPELFTSRAEDDCWNKRFIRTNYRCDPEIVDAANKLIAHQEGQIPMVCRPNPAKPMGEANIIVDTPGDNAAGAIKFIASVRAALDADPETEKPQDYAVLARTNAELNDYETACILNEIPYMRRSGGSFLEAPEARAVLGYMDLASGTNYKQMKESLIDAFNFPARDYNGPEFLAKAIDEAFDNIARNSRINVDAINPVEVLHNSMMANELAKTIINKQAYKLNNPRWTPSTRQWVIGTKITELKDKILQMGRDVDGVMAKMMDAGTKVDEVIEHILDEIKVEQGFLNKKTGEDTRTMASVRDRIKENVMLYGGDEDSDEDEDEKAKPALTEVKYDDAGNVEQIVAPPALTEEEDPGKGLGAVRFLYALAVPNANDNKQGIDPTKALDFKKKLDRFDQVAKELRVDMAKWNKEQMALPEDQRQDRPDALTLSTVHSVKGAQWRNCNVVMAPGIFPRDPPKPKGGKEPSPEELAQYALDVKADRNLAYVALTRAAKNLTVQCPGGLSKFVVEAELKPGQNVAKPGVPEAGGNEGVPVKTASEVLFPTDEQRHTAAIADNQTSSYRRAV